MSGAATDLGDAFASLWDGLDAGLVCSRHGEDILDDANWRRSKSSLATRIAERGLIPKDVHDAAQVHQAERLRLLLAIDEAMATVWPGWGWPIPNALLPVRRQWSQTGRLSSEPKNIGGAVLIRHVTPQRPASREEVDTLFRNLLRVDEHGWGEISHQRVPVAMDFSSDRVSRGQLTIATCPFTADLADIDIYTDRKKGQATYRLAGRDCQTLRDRIHDVIPLLDRSGADLAVLPEGILSPSLLSAWSDELRTSFPGRPRDSALRWVLVGTGPASEGSTRNTAVVLHRSGKELVRQDKRYPFTFTQSADWRMGDLVESGAQEDIERGGERMVIESEFGRVSITICEDLSRPLVFEGGLRQAGSSLLLVPVFNKPFEEHNWARRGASEALLHIGSRVVVANSLAVASRWPELEPCYALGIFHTEGIDSWEVRPERSIGEHALTVKTFSLTPLPQTVE